MSKNGGSRLKIFHLEGKLEKLTYVLEMIITLLLAIGIIIGLLDLVKFFPIIFVAEPSESYQIFEDFLGYALVLIVGIELMLMIINHSTRAILELILFVIARKMLIYAHTMLDLVLGTLAIAIVFAIIRFLIYSDNDEDIIKREKNIYGASAKVKDVSKRTGLSIPDDKGVTIGGLVSSLADEANHPVEEGSIFRTGNIKIEVLKVSRGLIKEVKITKNVSLHSENVK